MITLPTQLSKIMQSILNIGASPVIVGGYVRDALMDQESKDIDIEVFGIDKLDDLVAVLHPFGSLKEVGKSFGVLKLSCEDYELDISLPRVEKKIGRKHTDFSVTTHAQLSFKEAARRRDFRMNAIGYDVKSATLLDPYNGIGDIKERKISHIDDKTFQEDSLRVLRALGFAARFSFEIDHMTKELCKKMVQEGELSHLSKERIFEEIKKIFLKAKKPSIAFHIADELGINKELFPEIDALKGVKQREEYHPEGDVFTHTLMALDVMSEFSSEDEKKKLILMFATLCHDFGKATTTKLIEGVYRAYGHEVAGVEIAENFLRRMTDDKSLIEAVLPLVRYHGEPGKFYKENVSEAAIRRLANRVNISLLVEVSRADSLGRTTKDALEGKFPAKEWLLQRADELDVKQSAPKAILLGRHLLEEGLKPSSEFKKILDSAFEEQLEGKITTLDDAKKWLKKYLIQLRTSN